MPSFKRRLQSLVAASMELSVRAERSFSREGNHISDEPMATIVLPRSNNKTRKLARRLLTKLGIRTLKPGHSFIRQFETQAE